MLLFFSLKKKINKKIKKKKAYFKGKENSWKPLFLSFLKAYFFLVYAFKICLEITYLVEIKKNFTDNTTNKVKN